MDYLDRCSGSNGSILAAGLVAVLLAGGSSPAEAQVNAGVYDLTDDRINDARNGAESNNPSPFNGLDLNTFLGADRFYNAGFTGSNTIAANVEAGHAWNGHESLGHISQFVNDSSAFGTTTNDLFDRHATWTAQLMAGRQTPVNARTYQDGIAFGADLRSGAIATQWNGNAYALGFGLNTNTVEAAYGTFFGTADVINSSWTFADPEADSGFANLFGGYANDNPNTSFVASAGNANLDPFLGTPNSVGAPASGYNIISAGALGSANDYDTVSSFSSRGPLDYADPVNGTVAGVRPGVHLSAPGQEIVAAFYGGQTGGNNPSLPGSSNDGLNPNFYSTSVQGTSFSAPLIAGGVALLHDAQAGTPALAVNPVADDARVIKAVLLNSADKVNGTNGAAWDNGQTLVGGVVTTDQALDYAVGAGRMNLDQAFDQYVTPITQDVAGTIGGVVGETGWDYGIATEGTDNIYTIASLLEGGTDFTVTLNWFREQSYNEITNQALDLAFADLDLLIRNTTTGDLIAQSVSGFSEVEHLSFVLPEDGFYQIEVDYFGDVFDLSSSLRTEEYGLAWFGVAVPEPGVAFVLFGGLTLSMLRRRAA
jgi:hypothetical protein